MEAQDSSTISIRMSNRETGTRRLPDDAFEQAHRTQVTNLVLGCWDAVRRGQLETYLHPIPITRLNLAQSAFREITAIRIANILRSGAYRLRRASNPDPISEVVADLTTSLGTAADCVNDLLARFVQAGTQGEATHRDIPLQPDVGGGVAPMTSVPHAN